MNPIGLRLYESLVGIRSAMLPLPDDEAVLLKPNIRKSVGEAAESFNNGLVEGERVEINFFPLTP